MIDANVLTIIMKKLDIELDEKIQELLKENTFITEFKKNTIVLKQGDRSSNIYFIIKGLVRGYYLNEEGEDVTKCFSSEEEAFCFIIIKNS